MVTDCPSPKKGGVDATSLKRDGTLAFDVSSKGQGASGLDIDVKLQGT
jgi:hypothetical protein